MIKILELREIIRLVSKSTIQEFNMKNKGIRISMKKSITVAQRHTGMNKQEAINQSTYNETTLPLDSVYHESKLVGQPSKDDENKPKLHKVLSTGIGVFASPSELGTDTLVKVGNRITEGTVLGNCKVEPLNLEYEIISYENGVIAEILVDDGDIVEYGQPLYLVKAE